MQLFHPQLLLTQTREGDYFLHATTYVDKISLVNKGYKVAKKLSKDRTLKVELYSIEDSNIIEGEAFLNPIVHRINLGNLLGEEDILIEVNHFIKEEYSNKRSNGTKKRKKRTSTGNKIRSGGHTRPNFSKIQ